MARKLTAVFRDQSPLREFFLLRALDIKTTNFVSSEFEPVHVVRKVEHQVVRLRVMLEELTLRHQVVG